ncbi:hypothetical protein BKA70DRAFT_1268616 [Coprinopsis sp. MPI-PUGE-AT-0042]|nr:hypothetical protein BKA70DRAFT_1268616 [Coprinopsis sp. MPI-PUGE-AT-0042]
MYRCLFIFYCKPQFGQAQDRNKIHLDLLTFAFAGTTNKSIFLIPWPLRTISPLMKALTCLTYSCSRCHSKNPSNRTRSSCSSHSTLRKEVGSRDGYPPFFGYTTPNSTLFATTLLTLATDGQFQDHSRHHLLKERSIPYEEATNGQVGASVVELVLEAWQYWYWSSSSLHTTEMNPRRAHPWSLIPGSLWLSLSPRNDPRVCRQQIHTRSNVAVVKSPSIWL